MKIFLLIYVIQGAAAQQSPTVERIEQRDGVACQLERISVEKQLRVDKCVEGKWCDAPYLVRTACVEGS